MRSPRSSWRPAAGVLALALVGAVVGVRRFVRTHGAARPAVSR